MKNFDGTIGNRTRDQSGLERSASTKFATPYTRNEYRKYFHGGKGARRHLHVQNVMPSGSLKFLEPSGPVRACNGIDLPVNSAVLTRARFCLLQLQSGIAIILRNSLI
jgi:hypothetical protein